MVTEKIITIAEWRDNLTKGVLKSQRTVEAFSDTMRKTTTVTKDMSNRMTRVSKVTKTMTGNFRRFQAQLLSVLFFGLALSAFFGSLLKPALQLVGIFELWSNLLAIFFLPIALALLPVFLEFMKFFLQLSEPMQLAIGFFILFGFILGKLLFLIGVFGLGIAGLQLAWIRLAPVLAKIMGLLGAPFLVILAILTAVVIGFWLAWKTNFAKIRDWTQVIFDGLKQFFGGIIDFFKGWWKFVSGLFTGNEDKVVEGFLQMGAGIKKAFKAAGKIILGLLVVIGISVLRFFLALGKGIVNAVVTGAKLAVKAVRGFAGRVRQKITGSRQSGGFIPRDGLFRLHAGETVIPAGQTINFNPSIIVNVKSGEEGGMIDRLRSEINESFARGVGDLARR